MIKELVKDIEKLSVRTKEFEVLANGQEDSIRLLQDLVDTLDSLDNKLFLTANEIGYDERAFAIKFNDETEVFMNPAIQSRDRIILYREKDPLNNQEYIVPRYTETSLVFQDCLGKVRAFKFNEAASIIVCQAMDLLNGVLPSDYGLEVIPEFDEATEEERAELLSEYVKSLSSNYKDLDAELTNSEDHERWEAAKFIRGIADGEVQLEEKPLSNRKKKKINKFLKTLKKKGKH